MIGFGPFSLRDGTLIRDGKPVPVGQRALALLEALATGDGPVDKATLIEAAWPGTVVEEGNLTAQIAALRKALGARPDGSEWIVTVPRVGYRLVRAEGRPESSQMQQGPQLPSIAVLPFQNMSSDAEQDYFADGIVEDITTGLSRFRSIIVTARNFSFELKGKAIDVREAARYLRVRYVLEGSVRRAGNQLRISAQLIDGETGAHLWAEHFDGPVEDVFEVQDRITAGVVSIVEPLIQQAEIERTRLKPPSSLGSYDLYLQALSLATSPEPGVNERAADLIERSLAIDPDFVPALALGAGIEVARFDRQQAGAGDMARRRGLDYAHRALAARSADANTRAMAGVAIIILGFEYDAGMAALRKAAADNVNSTTVLGYAATGAIRAGEFDEAERYVLRAIDLNPADFTWPWHSTAMAHLCLSQRRFSEAVNWANRALAVSPANPIALWFLMASLAHLQRLAEAREWRKRLEELVPNSTLASIRAGQAMRDPKHLEVIIDGLRLAGVREE